MDWTPPIIRLSVLQEIRRQPVPETQAPPPPEPPVTECRAFIRFCRDSLVPLIDRAAEVTPKELRLLRDLRTEKGESAAQVARRLGIDDGEMSRLTRKLEAKGLLAKTPAPDRRAIALRLTPTGRALVDRSSWAEHMLLETRLQELSAEDQARLKEAMAVVMEVLGGGDVECDWLNT
jgi:DNA-binding MarR family transcriptional regulator